MRIWTETVELADLDDLSLPYILTNETYANSPLLRP